MRWRCDAHQEPVEWTGAVHAALYAQLGAKDCDLIVR
eukprot:COSAG04_NODE_3846_length_2478_cov_1.182430_4_plen_36_part_01